MPERAFDRRPMSTLYADVQHDVWNKSLLSHAALWIAQTGLRGFTSASASDAQGLVVANAIKVRTLQPGRPSRRLVTLSCRAQPGGSCACKIASMSYGVGARLFEVNSANPQKIAQLLDLLSIGRWPHATPPPILTAIDGDRG